MILIEAKRLPYTGRRFAFLTEGDKPMQPIRFPEFEIEVIRKRIRRINLHVTPEKVWMSFERKMSCAVGKSHKAQGMRKGRRCCISGSGENWSRRFRECAHGGRL